MTLTSGETGAGRWRPDASILPDDWELQRLKYLGNLSPSNVDKKSNEEEPTVKLCNYTDVYYHENIDRTIDFMEATTSERKIERFELQKGDILFTKDSESSDDIGVPAFVSEDLDNVICGYHLFIIRPNEEKVDPEYLYWAIKSKYVNFQFEGAATGVTRVGLSLRDASDTWIPVPPRDQQSQMVDYIKSRDSEVEKLIREKKNLINILEEKRESTIEDHLTPGLNAEDDFGTASWSVNLPDEWSLTRGNGLFYEVDKKSEDGEEMLFSLRKDQGLVPHSEVSEKELEPEDLEGYKKVQTGQLVMNRMRAATGLIDVAPSDGIVSPDYAIFETKEKANPHFYQLLFQTELYKTMFRSRSIGLGTGSAGFLRLYSDRFLSLQFPHPPIETQKQIVSEVEEQLHLIDDLSNKTEKSIEQLKERRNAIITCVVTGQIDTTGTKNPVQEQIS